MANICQQLEEFDKIRSIENRNHPPLNIKSYEKVLINYFFIIDYKYCFRASFPNR
jgi:hypothetical protein